LKLLVVVVLNVTLFLLFGGGFLVAEPVTAVCKSLTRLLGLLQQLLCTRFFQMLAIPVLY